MWHNGYMSLHRASGNTEGIEKFQVLSGKIKMMMDVFLAENPEMTNLIMDLHIGDPHTHVGPLSTRYLAEHSVTITFDEMLD